MTPPHTHGVTPALLAAVAIAACSSTQRVALQEPTPSPQPITTDSLAIAKARADSVRHPYTEADIHFMSGMIRHHAQAIVMARWAPTHGAGERVSTLAERIINAQQDEIFTMQRWLDDRLQPVPDARATGMTMMINGVEQKVLMPGMLTPDQMHLLDQARGADFDQLFLLFMIMHHRGGVTMVQDLFSSYGAGQDELTFKLASDINADQTTEIVRMEKMLATPTSPQRN